MIMTYVTFSNVYIFAWSAGLHISMEVNALIRKPALGPAFHLYLYARQ